ncbi:retrovirus-related Pol polyprotein from transposon 412 [Trichonephila clavipes]|nr:retrovirus-related Pol polyprotein from transposon 412 [Trichonephila clavipes]
MPLDYGFVQQLKNHMNHLKPLSTSTHGFSKNFVHPKLDDCSHVFLRVDKVSPSLSQPFATGPHEVLSRNNKHITININGKKSCVSLDRVKPAFVFKICPIPFPDPIISAESSHRHPVTTNMQTTKSDYIQMPPLKFATLGSSPVCPALELSWQEQDVEELEFLDPVQSEERMVVGNLTGVLSLIE